MKSIGTADSQAATSLSPAVSNAVNTFTASDGQSPASPPVKTSLPVPPVKLSLIVTSLVPTNVTALVKSATEILMVESAPPVAAEVLSMVVTPVA